MRPRLSCVVILPMLCGIALPAAAAPLAETLAGAWTCIAKEGESNVAMTLNYRRSYDWLIGEITEDNGAALLDVWFDDFGGDPLAQRRILSNDATIEMKLIEEAPTWMKLEGELRHILGTTAHVREEIRFTGRDEFRAIWEADNGDGWQLVLDRSCKRI